VSEDLLRMAKQIVAEASPEARQNLIAGLRKDLEAPWMPQPGPQADAYDSVADETLYGGAAGGGKTDLIVGLATTAHQRSLIFRRQSTDLDGIWERLESVVDPGGLVEERNSVKKRMQLKGGRVIEMGHLEKPGSEKSWQGRPHDLIAFDEAAQLDEAKVVFVSQWLRSTSPGQRQRILFATNPPIPEMRGGEIKDTATGDWLKRWFAPWIDTDLPVHEKAKTGELRWCIMRVTGDEYETLWVPGPGWYVVNTGEPWDGEKAPTDEQIKAFGLASAKSRTFIQSLVTDNAYLRGSGYMERLSSTPEPLRSMLLHGSFGIKMEDHPFQAIPTEWVLAAEQRWRERMTKVREGRAELAQMRVLAADVAQGGRDMTTIAPLREDWTFDRLHRKPGIETPDGPSVVANLLQVRRDRATIVLDTTGGWGNSARDVLKSEHGMSPISCTASTKTGNWTPNMLWRYGNLRAEMWWRFRLALDPESGFSIALPPNDRTRAQLTAPHYRIRGKEVFIEEKEELRKRLNSSTDDADAIIMAFYYFPTAMARARKVDPVAVEHAAWTHEMLDETTGAMGVEEINPLSDWG
jgi:hypothetical protein